MFAPGSGRKAGSDAASKANTWGANSPVLVGDRLVYRCQGYIFGLDTRTGSVVWEDGLKDADDAKDNGFGTAPIEADGRVGREVVNRLGHSVPCDLLHRRSLRAFHPIGGIRRAPLTAPGAPAPPKKRNCGLKIVDLLPSGSPCASLHRPAVAGARAVSEGSPNDEGDG